MKPFYQKIWFIWLMIFLFFPIGFVFLWLYSGYTKQAKCLIMAGFLILLSVSNTQNHHSPMQKEEYKPQQAVQTETKITKANFFDLSQNQIALALSVPVVEMNMKDYWEMSQDTGFTITKGTFKHDGKTHSFKCTFGTETTEPIALYIDEHRIFWLEERQDEITDSQIAK